MKTEPNNEMNDTDNNEQKKKKQGRIINVPCEDFVEGDINCIYAVNITKKKLKTYRKDLKLNNYSVENQKTCSKIHSTSPSIYFLLLSGVPLNENVKDRTQIHSLFMDHIEMVPLAHWKCH